MQHDMHLKKITEISQFYALQKQWNSLLATRKSIPLPLTHGWVSTWWNAFNHNKSLQIFCIYNNHKLIAIAPFYKEKSSYRGIAVQQLHLLSDGHSPFSDIIYDHSLPTKQINQILKLLIKENKNDLIVFAKLPKNSPTYQCLVKPGNTADYNIVVKENLITPTIQITGTWDNFFGKRSRKFHKSINHKLNRFKKEPDFKIDCEKVTSIDHPVLKDIISISRKSWKAGIKGDLGSDTAGRIFLLDLVKTFAAGNHIQVWILRKNLTPVAYEFHIIFDNIVYPVRADYDEHYKKYSPGSILEYTVLKHLFNEQHVNEYYTCADNYWYLNNWSNDLREHYTVEVFSSGLKAHSLHFIESHIIPIARYIKGKLQPEQQTAAEKKQSHCPRRVLK